MDWAKAKLIIILLLLSFNIFLLGNILNYANDANIPSETLQNTVKILSDRGVTLECDIPRYNKDTPKLIYGGDGHNRSEITDKLLGDSYSKSSDGNTYTSGNRVINFGSENVLTYRDTRPADAVDITHENSIDRYVRAYLEGSGLINSSFVLDSMENDGNGSYSLNYIEKYRGYLIFDNYLNVKLTDKGITYLESREMKIQGLSTDKTGDISAAYQILLGNFTGSEKLVITNIDLGFKSSGGQDMDGIESGEQFSVWRVKIKGSDTPRYFSTSDGKELK